jgi:hypothetical protein
MPVREFDCLRLGTAMAGTYRKRLLSMTLGNSSAYALTSGIVKSEIGDLDVEKCLRQPMDHQPNCLNRKSPSVKSAKHTMVEQSITTAIAPRNPQKHAAAPTKTEFRV